MRTDVRSIVVFACNLLGDSICRLPAIKAAKEAYPHARLAVVVDPACVDVFQGQPFLDEIWPLNRRLGRARQGLAWARLLRRIRAAKPDLALDLYGSRRTELVSRLSGAKTRVGLLPAAPAAGSHIIQQVNEVVRRAGLEARFEYVPLALDDDDRTQAESMLAALGLAKPLLLNPSARVAAKRWRAERFGDLARALARRGLRCGVITAPGQEAMTQAVVQAAQGDATALPPVSLKHLAAVLERASLLVTGDTGVLHLGAAMGCPAVILAGPTDPRLVFCEPCRQVVLFHREACHEWTAGQQCRLHHQCARRDCLDAITVGEVEAAVSELLGR